jgi:class 3 adenylate cyclase
MNEIQQLENAIKALETQRAVLGDAIVNITLEPLRQKLEVLKKAQQESIANGERKLVTVMFADLSGFTALSEKLDPESVREIMNACFDALVPIVEKYGGVIDKFIGDEIMALFGAPVAKENDAERALRASLEMMARLEEFNRERETKLGMHFGINTGLVVAGGLGSEGRQQYSVMGDAVNLAARLEGASESGEIYVGPTTYKLTNPFFEFEKLSPMSLKGKSEPVQIYLLKGLKKQITRERGIEGLFSPLVGRDKELFVFERFFKNQNDVKGGVLAVSGEAGLGKSRLVSEVKGRFLEQLQWFEGRALSHMESVSYAMVNSLLDAILGVDRDISAQALSDILEEYLKKTFPKDSHFLLPYLSRLRGLPPKPEFEQTFKDVLPTAIRTRMHQAFETLVVDMASQGPLVLVWEDLHWADASSLGLLEHLVPLSQKLPLFILLISRNQENIAAWMEQMEQKGLSIQRLEIVPLSQSQSTELVQNLLRIENLPQTTLEIILSKSEGNPFFLEELLRSLIESGMVIMESGIVKASEKITDFQVPDTLQGIIAARLDRLPLESKRTLQNASVIGRIFQESVLKLNIDRESASLDLHRTLNELQHKTLIRNRESAEYIFKHAITHDVTYNSLLISRRKTLHLLTAESIEAIFPDQLEELAPNLGFHFAHGGNPQKAAAYFLQAAEKAERNYANREALNFYRQAIGQIEKQGETFQKEQLRTYYEKVGSVHSLLGHTAEALEAFDQALSNIGFEDRITQARITRMKGLAFNAARNTPQMMEKYFQAAALLGDYESSKDKAWTEEWLNLKLDLAWALYIENKVPELDGLVEKISPVIELHGSLPQKNRLYGTLFLLDLRRYRYYMLPDATIDRLYLQLETAKQIGNKALIGRAMVYSGFARMWRNEHELAEKIFLESFPDIEHVGDMDSLMIGKCYIALAARKKGDLQKAESYALASLDLAQAVNNQFYIGNSLGMLGWTAWKNGDREKARSYLESAKEAFSKFPAPNPIEFVYKGPMMGMAVEDGDWENAVAYSKFFLNPNQQQMPDGAYVQIEKAITSWESRDLVATKEAFQKLIELLEKAETGYV